MKAQTIEFASLTLIALTLALGRTVSAGESQSQNSLLSKTKLEASMKASPQRLDIREQLARLSLQAKEWDKVVEYLNSYTDVISPSGFLLLAAAYQEKKNFSEAVRVLNLLSDKRPKDEEVHYIVGDAKLKWAQTTKDLKSRQDLENQAVENFRTAIKLKKNFGPAHSALVNYFIEASLNMEAREQLAEMLKIFGPRPDIHTDLCRLFAVDGFLSQAIANCSKAVRLSPRQPSNFVYLAQAYFDQKELEKSESTLINAARSFPQSEIVQYAAGHFFFKKNNFPVAARYLSQAVAANAESARSQLNFAQALFETGQETEALGHFQKACQLNSSLQSDFMAAATKLRLKGSTPLSARYSQAAGACRK